jgi:hypothetical protein
MGGWGDIFDFAYCTRDMKIEVPAFAGMTCGVGLSLMNCRDKPGNDEGWVRAVLKTKKRPKGRFSFECVAV